MLRRAAMQKTSEMNTLRLLLLASLIGLAAPPASSAVTDDVMAADRSFAARAVDAGQAAAFSEYLAEDAVLFRPEAVSGQEWIATHEAATGRLEWWPSAAAVACTGRLAISSGPWRYSNAAGGEPVAGHYLSVWRLGGDGRWRVVLDHGIDHAPSAVPAEPLDAAFLRFWPTPGQGECKGRSGERDLAKAEDSFNALVHRSGLPEAMRRAAADGALAYRDDAPPGRLTAQWPTLDIRFGPGTVARSVGMVTDPDSDIAVSHGVLQATAGASAALYIRVWTRERRHWRLAIDVQTPLPASPGQ
jgi:ketosteroid isomerase-like protein